MGEPLHAMFSLELVPPAAIDVTSPAALEEDAVKNRPRSEAHV
jgi:hypothetical protein